MYAGYKEEQMTLGTIVIFGLDMKPSSVKMNGILVVFTFNSNKVSNVTVNSFLLNKTH